MAICGLSMGALPLWQRYHAIISNPPLHQGKDRTLAPLTELLQAAPSRLIDEGKLILVVQRHEPLQKPLQELFLNVALLAEDSRYRVWCASKPHAWVLAPEAPAEEAAEERPRRKKRRED
jgi:16S rRNA G1207 methylase RsmC